MAPDAARIPEAGRRDASRLDASSAPDAFIPLDATTVVDAWTPPGPCVPAAPTHAFPVRRSPFSLAIGDVNGDGIQDMAVGAEHGSVHASDGRGSFARTDLVTSSIVVTWHLAELDGDGILDLLGDGYDTFLVRLGRGDGTFGAQAPITGSSYATVAAIADVDDDGTADIVVTRTESATGTHLPIGERSVLWGNGDGTFRAGPTESSGTAQPELAVADLDRDGHLDLVQTDPTTPDQIRVLRGIGDGTFVPHVGLATSAPIASLIANVDWNRDGTLDLLAATNAGVHWLEGNGDATFQGARSITTTPSEQLVIEDVDEDRLLDLVSARAEGTTAPLLEVSIFRGASDASATLLERIAIDGRLVLRTAHADADSHPDLVVVDGSSNTLRILHGNGDGTFQPAPVLRAFGVSWLANEDVDRDGLLDIIAIQYTQGPLVLRGDGTGSFEPQPRSPYPRVAGAGAPLSIAMVHLDGDSRRDMLVGLYPGLSEVWGGFDVLLASSAGGFGPPQHIGGRTPAWFPEAADLDGDRNIDVTFATNTPTRSLAAMRGNGDGTFQPARTLAEGTDGRRSIADVDRDGDADIVVSMQRDTTLLRGRGDGTFEPSRSIGVASGHTALVDLDADGILDLVAASVDTEIQILRGRGDGTFEPARAVPGARPSAAVWALRVADVDADARPDLVFSAEDSTFNGVSRARIFLGNGDGTFRDAAAIDTGVGAFASTVGDFNGDGRLDIAIGNTTSATVVIINTCGLF